MNLSRKPIASALLAATLLLGASLAQAQVTVPNTFGAGTPASSAQVNQNFQALANAVNAANAALDAANSAIAALNAATSTLNTALNTTNTALGTTNTTLTALVTPGPAVTSSYRLQPSAIVSDLLSDRNVVVLVHPGDGDFMSPGDEMDAYVVQVAYQSSTDTIPVGGIETNFPYFFQEIRITPYVCDGLCSYDVSITKMGSDSPTFNPYTAVEMSGTVNGYASFIPGGTTSTAYRVTRELGCSPATQVFNQARFCYTKIEEIEDPVAITNVDFTFDAPIFLKLPATSIAGISYADLAVLNNNGSSNCFEPGMRAANLGPVTGRINCGYTMGGNAFAVYYRINGIAVGDLSATAFSSTTPTSATAPYNWLYGLWIEDRLF